MQTGQLPIRVSVASFFPPLMGNLIRPIEPTLQRFFFPDELTRSIRRAEATGHCAGFGETVLNDLNIRLEVAGEDLQRIPVFGAALAVANHPFGFLEGFILLSVLEKVRPDYKIVANSLLSSVELLRDHVIFVNPYPEQGATRENARALRSCLDWLEAGGLLVTFPAGAVAHLNWGGEHAVADPKWSETSARFARKIGCPTIPMFFGGGNSIPFQMFGSLHPRLRTLNLPRELMKKRSQKVRLSIGTPVAASVLKQFDDAESATAYLRARVYLLSSRANATPAFSPLGHFRKAVIQVEAERPGDAIAREVAALPPDRLLASNDEFDVYVASASEIPNTLREIGRCRELTFRQVGEGTNSTVDLDRFDNYYQHLFLWSKAHLRIAGAYRVAATPDVLPTRGMQGLYTSTLFQYAPDFFDRMGPAFELGRSFVRLEYQKHYSPLLLLWKGIARCIQRRPECAVVFGAVSISSDYHPLSRVLIMNFINSHMVSDLAPLVKPRRGYRPPALIPRHVKQLGRLLGSIEELSSSVSDLERDGKGVPVLIRQYLRVGGQFLGFNLDPGFSNALDGLILTDLRSVAAPILDRFMGRSAADAFRTFHALKSGVL